MNKIIISILVGLLCTVSLPAALWQMPPIEFQPVFGNSYQYVATDFKGNAITIWSRNISDGSVQASYFSADTGSYGPPVTVFIPVAGSCQGIQLAMDQTGAALAIWFNFATSEIGTAYFSEGIWSLPLPVPLDTVSGSPTDPSIAMNGLGQGVATWISQGSLAIRTSFFSAGSWSVPNTIGTGMNINSTSVSYSLNGTAVAVWNDDTNVTVSYYNNILWQMPVVLDSATSYPNPIAGIDASGNAAIVWFDNLNNIVTSYYDGTVWSAVQTLSESTGNIALAFTMAPNGTAVAAWQDSALNGQYATFNGVNWSAPAQFATNITSALNVTSDTNGNARIVWTMQDNYDIFSAPLSLAGVLGPSELVASGDGIITVSAIENALSDNGRAFTTWNALDVENVGVYGTYSLFAVVPDIGGRVCQNKFAMQTDRVHIVTFTPSTDPTVVAYYLSRNGALIAILPPGGPYIYYDHNRVKNKPDTYSIVAVTPTGTSQPVSIVLN